MLNDEICELREKLNESIEENESYEYIYTLSVKLDKLIEEYYGLNNRKINTKDNRKLIIR